MNTFTDLGVRPRTIATLATQNITSPTPIQSEAIRVLISGKDAVLQAPTGSGKTLAFTLPLIERLQGHSKTAPRALIVGPTRELAGQIEAVIRGVDPGLRTALLIGGVGYGRQTSELHNRPDVIIGCPGRLLDLAGQGLLNLSAVEYLVLDEADEMLDQGFARDVERIMGLVPARRQTVLASATMPGWVEQMIQRHLTDPARIATMAEAIPDIEQALVEVSLESKLNTLDVLLRRRQGTAQPKTIVFHRTKHGAKRLARDLTRLGHAAGELQGNLSQNARDRAIGDFRSGATSVLVATNVAARGIDVDGIGLVINYELPETAQWLTHRVGRTGRNGASGRALTIVTEADRDQWRKLRRLGAEKLRQIATSPLVDHDRWEYLNESPWSMDHGAPQLRSVSGSRPTSAGQHRRRRSPRRPAIARTA